MQRMSETAVFVTLIVSSFLVLNAGTVAHPALAQEKVPTRDEIAPHHMWDLTDLFESDQAWESAFRGVSEKLKDFEKYQGKLGQSPDMLLECLELSEEASIQMGLLYSYAAKKRDQDLGNTTYQAMSQRAQSLMTKMANATAFMEPEILSISEEKLERFLKESEELRLYEHHLEDIRRVKDHILSKEQEELLAITTDVMAGSFQAFRMMTNADFTWDTITDEEGNQVEMSQGRYYLYMTSPDRRVRHDAYKELYVPYEAHLNTITSLLTTSLKADVFYSRARKYDSALAAALSGPNVPVEVYHNLVNTLNDNLEPLHRWAEIKKRVLDLDELHPYDTYAPLFPEFEKTYTYEEAQEIIKIALEPLGEKVQNILDRAFNERWIDVYENVGKRGGAYSSGAYGVHPYILMNFDGTLTSVSTLAHELGHTMHSYLTNEVQPYIYADYAIFNAEVASTTNEALLFRYLIEHAGSEEEKLSLLQEYIQRFGSTFYRQTRFAEFDLLVHEMVENDEPLTHEVLNESFGKHYQKFWGPAMVVDEEESISWSRIPHFYYNFYVYTYATSFAASQAIVKGILEEGDPAVSRYLEFLSSGRSDYPVELLAKAGVDMSTPEPIKATTRTMHGLLDQIEEILAGK